MRIFGKTGKETVIQSDMQTSRRVRKHLYRQFEDIRYALDRFVVGKGVNKDFGRMTEHEKWFLGTVREDVENALQTYDEFLWRYHGNRDRKSFKLLPYTAQEKIKTVKRLTRPDRRP